MGLRPGMCQNKSFARIHIALSILQRTNMQYRPEGWSLRLKWRYVHQRTQMAVPTCEYVINLAVSSMRIPWKDIRQIHKHTHEIQKTRGYYQLTLECRTQVRRKPRNHIYDRLIQGNWRSPGSNNMTYEWLGFRFFRNR